MSLHWPRRDGNGVSIVGHTHIMKSLVERMCTRGQEGSCERGRERGEGVRLHRRLGAAPKAICISRRVFWNSSQSRLNSIANQSVNRSSRAILLPRRPFPPSVSTHCTITARVCFPIHIVNVNSICLSFYGISVNKHASECGRLSVAGNVRVNSPNRPDWETRIRD